MYVILINIAILSWISEPMLHRIIDLIVQEDTFKLFTDRARPNVFCVLEPRIKTAEELAMRIRGYFSDVLASAPADSLCFNEASRMLCFVERIFKELREMNEVGRESVIRDPMDDTIDVYCESLRRFVEDVDVPVVQEHVRFVTL